MQELDEKAQNPFISDKAEYNPFRDSFNRTYVWIEEDKKDKK